MTDPRIRLQATLEDRYRIERELGQGGMATVYLAHDVRHDRHVALKVLRPELSAILGADRFLAEIKTTANLQHPHILSLYDSGEADGVVFYVMPYIEGESLRDRLVREKQLPVEEAVRIAREVASALDYAHRHGVVHRDIKPENILLHDGTAMVADFGIALAVSRSDGGTRMTETGMSLGTPHYMSPEQAMGEREITAKSDVYALGCVLYEMLVGEPPFTGPTAQAIVARVMTEEPRALTIQRKTIPPHVEAAVHTALAKLPADRFATAAQFGEALTGQGPAVPITRAAPAAGRPASTLRRPAVVAAALSLLALGVLAGLRLRGAPGTPLTRLSVVLPATQRLSGLPFSVVGLSPDGRSLAYLVDEAGSTRLYLRQMDEPVARAVDGSEASCCPVFSADSRWLHFFKQDGVFRVPVSGGTPSAIPSLGGVLGLVPIKDGLLVTDGTGALTRIYSSGQMDTILPGNAAVPIIAWDALPGGRVLATLGFFGPLAAIAPDGGRVDTLVNALVTAGFHSQGYIAWVEQSGVAFGAMLDRSGRRIAGQPIQLSQDVRVLPGGAPAVTSSRNGTLAFVGAQPSQLVTVDRAGRYRAAAGQRHRYHSPRVSPDGRMIAVDVTEPATRNVWLFNRRDSSMTRLSFENGGHDPMWADAGRTVVFAANVGGAAGIFRRNADGSGAAESVLVTRTQLTAHTVGLPGQVLAVVFNGSNQDIVSVPLTGASRTTTTILGSPFTESFPALSPDGRLLAYASDESGRNEVYVRAFPGPGTRTIVSQSGGSEPVWSRNGRELFYRAAIGEPMLVAAVIETRPELRVVSRTPLFNIGEYEPASPHANYDVMSDGSGFVMVRQGRASEISVILNWPEIVRRQSATAP